MKTTLQLKVIATKVNTAKTQVKTSWKKMKSYFNSTHSKRKTMKKKWMKLENLIS